MTDKQFLATWMEVSKNYNSIGSVLDMLGITALYEAFDMVEGTPLFRHRVKQRLNQCVKAAGRYEKIVKGAYAEKYGLWADYNMAMQKRLRQHVFVVYNSVHMFLARKKVRNLNECAKLLTALMLIDNARRFHEDFFDEIETRTHIRKFRQLYSYADMRGLCSWMNDVCKSLIRFDDATMTEYGNDANICLALTAINNFLNVEDNLNSAAREACEMDIENYGDALAELAAEEAARNAAEEAERAAAEQVAAEMEKEAEAARKEAIAMRLGERFKVVSA